MGKEKAKKRQKSESEESSGSSSSDSEKEKKKLKKLKKKLKKEQKKTEKALKRRLKEERKRMKKKHKDRVSSRKSESDSSRGSRNSADNNDKQEDQPSTDIPIELMEKSKAMAPMTKEEWEKRQSVVRRVVDEETGRHRLIKGDGEVLEEIVSRERHRQINRQATLADGAFYQAVVNRDGL